MRRKLPAFFYIAFLISSFSPVFAQEAAAPEPVAYAQEAPEKTVTAIDVKGGKSISPNTIISKIKTKVGNPYLETIISDDLKRIYLLGYFEDVTIDTEDYKDGVKVIITVVEKPVIDKISFEGMKKLYYMKLEKLKEDIKSKEGQYLDQNTLQDDIAVLKGIYEKKGFTETAIEPKVDLNKETNRANVTYVVDEGGKRKVKKIIIKGNATFKRGRILKLIKTKTAWLFNAGTLKDKEFEEDIERIKSFYRREGFTDVAVTYDTQRDPGKPLLYITITIEEGKRYYVGNVTIENNKDISEQDIRSQLKVVIPGKVFSTDGLQADVNNVLMLYFDRGYIMAQVDESSSFNAQSDKIDITYAITENEINYVDKIKIKGNLKTKDLVIRRQLKILPGDRFDGEKLRRSKERLVNLGYFEEIDYETEPTDEPNTRNLLVDVKEAKTGTFSFGGGYSTVDQLVGFVEIEQKNFDWKNWPYFTGDGQNLSVRAQLGSVSQSYNISFTEPWMFDYPVSFGFDAYRTTHDQDEDAGYGYQEDVTGGAFRLGKLFTDYISGTVSYRYDVVDISDVPSDASSDLTEEEGTNAISSVSFGLARDSRDNVFFTRRGSLLTGSFEVAGLGGDKNFLKFFGRASKYFGLPFNSALELRVRVGLADPYGDSTKLPIYERFFAGGSSTIRGYDERSIGPVDSVTKDPLGGNALFVGNIEYIFPIFDFLKGVVFYDFGNVWATTSDFGKGDPLIYSGVGFGVRMKTPIGPISLDIGFPFEREPGKNEKEAYKLHWSMSKGF